MRSHVRNRNQKAYHCNTPLSYHFANLSICPATPVGNLQICQSSPEVLDPGWEDARSPHFQDFLS